MRAVCCPPVDSAAKACPPTHPVFVILSLLLGVRHTTDPDPDHIIAVSTIVSRERSLPLERLAPLAGCICRGPAFRAFARSARTPGYPLARLRQPARAMIRSDAL